MVLKQKNIPRQTAGDVFCVRQMIFAVSFSKRYFVTV